MSDYIDLFELSDDPEVSKVTLKLDSEQVSFVNSVSIPTGHAGMILGWHYPWMSVESGLPQDEQRCLIYTPSSNSYIKGKSITIHSATFYQGKHKADNEAVCFFDCNSSSNNKVPYAWKEGAMQWFGQDVTHWMPIPLEPECIERVDYED